MIQLKDIKKPEDIRGLSDDELRNLAEQMREAMLKWVSTIGGHVGPNLGVVEATLAMYQVFDASKDKIVWDVSHQDVAYKMLTGRVDAFLDPKLYRSISEYTFPPEAPEYDLFYAGHTSPSITLATGLAKARDLKGEKYNVVAFIGDGSLSGGVAFEGLDAAGALGTNLIVIVNDNQMAIAEDHGALYDNLRQLRETNGTADDNYFRSLGFDYLYVKEGNNLDAVRQALAKAKDSPKPIVVHIDTQKGQGYVPAERNREEFHYMPPFDLANGLPAENSDAPDYDTLTGKIAMEMIEKDPLTLVVTAATPGAFCFDEATRKRAGKQYMDVGIAEQCGVSVSAAAAKGGAKPIFVVESTFLQRALDQLIEDLSLDCLPATLLVQGTGVYGIPDVTHLGFWDEVQLSHIPNLLYLAPTSAEEYRAMVDWAHQQQNVPVAIRVPGGPYHETLVPVEPNFDSKWQTVQKGSEVALIAMGNMLAVALEAAKLLKDQGINATVINPRFISGVDEAALLALEADHKAIVTLEDSSLSGGFGEKVARLAGPTSMRVKCLGLDKKFIDRYNVDDVLKQCNLTPEGVAATAQELLK
ncbi:MAG: 1-deoxy-D-xylulose-5-phosphate synthase [Bacteroidales bacterium]|nr:1-deoxy-D-xylulose-5-phosphate synthase [Bacteroidales bacterium]